MYSVCYSKVVQLHTQTHTHTHIYMFFFILFSTMVYHRILNTAPYAILWGLLVYPSYA